MSDRNQVVLTGLLTGAGMIVGRWFGISGIITLALVLLFLALCHVPAQEISEVALWAVLAVLGHWILLHIGWLLRGAVWLAALSVVLYFLAQRRR